jgi:hypothetical protein
VTRGAEGTSGIAWDDGTSISIRPTADSVDRKEDLISGRTLTTATVATDDKVLIQDTSNSDNLKTVTAQAIANLAPGLSDGDKGDITVASSGTSWTIDTPASATVATDDKVLIKDTSASDVMKYVTAQSIRDLVPGSGTLTSAQLATSLTDETGSGANVFATSPTLVTPALGTPSSGTLTSCTGLPVTTGISGLGANVSTILTTSAAVGTTWTPTFTFSTPGDISLSYALQFGRYTKVGNVIYYMFWLTVTPTFTTSSGTIRIGGLPTACIGVNFLGGACITNSGFTYPAGRTAVFSEAAASNTYMNLIANGSAVAPIALGSTNVVSGAALDIQGTGFYMV